MNFFNIGTAELMLIFVIALIVVGPRRLPEIAKSFGKIVSDVRKISQEFTGDIMREVNAPAGEDEALNFVKDEAPNKVKDEALNKVKDEAKETAAQDVSEQPVQSLGKIINDVKKITQEFTEEVTRELNFPIDSVEDVAKKIVGQDVSEKASNGDQS